jgi:serine/threonine protein kinase
MMKDTTEIVCLFNDRHASARFGLRPENTIEPLPWLWDLRGQLMVISSPFHEGCHWAKYLGEFIPIVNRLKELHDRGYVHGDIRCRNLIFPEETCKDIIIAENADLFHLIDFDLGGKLSDSPPLRFPKGYKTILFDGLRVGADEEEITKWHDWFALKEIIFFHHDVRVPAGLPSWIRAEVRWTSSLFRECQSKADTAKEVDLLLVFLSKFRNWEVKLRPAFKSELTRLGLYKNGSGIGK